MHLPPDDTLTLTDTDPFVLDAADASALTDDVVLALLPAWVRRVDTRLRRALVTQGRAFWQYVHNRVGFALNAVRTPRHAAGRGLTAHGDRKRRARAPGESEAAYRDRLLTTPDIITPDAIGGAVRGLVRAERPTDPVLIEAATEGVFLASPSSPWVCFTQRRGSPPLWGVFPDNPLPWVGAWLPTVRESLGPAFVVMLEGDASGDLEAAHLKVNPMFAQVEEAPQFLGIAAVTWGYVVPVAGTLEDRVLVDIEARRGAGVVWTLYVDPTMGGAL